MDREKLPGETRYKLSPEEVAYLERHEVGRNAISGRPKQADGGDGACVR